MNNMMTLQHTQIKASFETSTHVVGHVFKVTLYKKLLGMVSMYALNEISVEYECVPYAGKNPSRCGCVMRSTHGLSCACELFKYVVSFIPLETICIFWRRLSFLDQGLSVVFFVITFFILKSLLLRLIIYKPLLMCCSALKICIHSEESLQVFQVKFLNNFSRIIHKLFI